MANYGEFVQPLNDLRSIYHNAAGCKPITRCMSPRGSWFPPTAFESDNYAKNAGNLLLVRPRVLGSKSSGVLETKEPRKFPLEFEGPLRDTDIFDIVLPPGYEVDELPPPTDADFSFGSYHSKTEASGQMLHYTRSMEIKELSVPVSRMDELKKFYRMIAADERNTVVLKPAVAGK
jgi:hypothetical protein